MMGIMSRAAGEPLRHVEVGEEGVDVNARVAGAQAEEGGEDDGQESASKLDNYRRRRAMSLGCGAA